MQMRTNELSETMPNGYLIESHNGHQGQEDIRGVREGDVCIPEMVALKAKRWRSTLKKKTPTGNQCWE